MLVLNRKRSEMIQIGDNILITIVQVGPQMVKIGIAAPDDVRIMRAELMDRPQSEQSHPLAVFLKKRRLEKRSQNQVDNRCRRGAEPADRVAGHGVGPIQTG